MLKSSYVPIIKPFSIIETNWEKCSDKVRRMLPLFVSSIMLLLNMLSSSEEVFSVTQVG